MFQISHMMEHIANLFNIKEPIHLMLNKYEYLPPNENIRILKENETILVLPGSGLKNDSNVSTSTGNREEGSVDCIKTEGNTTARHKQVQANICPTPLSPMQEPSLKENINKPQNDSLDLNHETEESEMSSISDMKNLETNFADNVSIADSFSQCPRRKRMRRRKKKEQTNYQETKAEEKQTKPKIMNSCLIPSGKHIRFDNMDNEDLLELPVIQSEAMNGSNIITNPSLKKLANLLSLGKNSTPITFTSRRVKHEIKREHVSDNESEWNSPSISLNESSTVKKRMEDVKESLNQDLNTCPIMTEKPQMSDVVAFKMLKIGPDYTPQVSDFIVGEVVQFCPKTSLYTLNILRGMSEVQVPIGKFTIEDEEEVQALDNTITLNFTQLMEPRLLSRKSEA